MPDTTEPKVLRPASQGDPFTGLWAPVDGCPNCGHQLEHVANGNPTAGHASVVAHCSRCRRDILAEVRLHFIRGGQRHG